MRGGILIIGSLLWDARPEREAWRKSRLTIDKAVHVSVPIHYGRRSASRGNTFTMTFASDGPLGQGVLVPCRTNLSDSAALLNEAEELWKAEQPTAAPGSIAASWGCVGLVFRDQPAPPEWLRAWVEHFHSKASPVPPVGSDGLLGIPWPAIAVDTAASVELLLATATKPDTMCPLAEDVADAWIDQDRGYERYFFENVRHGIRTADDGAIWRRLKERRARWLGGEAYAQAIAVLAGEERALI